MNNEMRKNTSWICFLLLVTGAMAGLQYADVLTLSDDILYHFMWLRDDSSPILPIRSLADLFESQSIHYQLVNGRWVVHSIAQAFFAFIPPVVLQTINAFLFTLMLYFGSRLMVSDEKRFFSLVLMCFLFFLVIADVKTTMLWSLGTFNYLWVSVATLLFLLWLRGIQHSESRIHWLLSPLSLLIGCSHEGIALPLSVTLSVYAVKELRGGRLYPQLLYILWYITGTFVCLFSPGIWSRAGGDITLFSRIVSGGINIFLNLRVTWLLVITLLLLYIRSRNRWQQFVYRRRYGYFCLLLALGIVVVCGTNQARVVFYADFIAVLLLTELWADIISVWWQRRLVVVFSVIMVLCYVPAFLVRLENYDIYSYMERQMNDNGSEVIAVHNPYNESGGLMDFFRHRYVNPPAEFGYYCCYMGFNAKDVNIRAAAVIFDKEEMIFLPEDVVRRIEEDPAAYQHYELDAHQQLYVWQLPTDYPVKKVIFRLNSEDFSSLSLLQRLLAYKGDVYELDDDFHYSVIHVNSCPYLVFTRPTTNIYRRIGSIDYQM